MRERQLTSGGVIFAVHASVKQAYGKYPFEDQLAADDLALRHRAADLAVQQLSSYVSADSAVDVKALEAKVEEMELILAANKKEIEALRSQLSALTEENKD